MSTEAVGPALPNEEVSLDEVMTDVVSSSEEKKAEEAGKLAAVEEREAEEKRAAAIRETLRETLKTAEEELRKTVQAFQQLLIKGAPQRDFDANEKRQATFYRTIKRMKEDMLDQKSNKQAPKEVVVPKNLPPLQLPGDKEVVASKVRFETIDRFVDVFEMVLL